MPSEPIGCLKIAMNSLHQLSKCISPAPVHPGQLIVQLVERLASWEGGHTPPPPSPPS